MDNKYFSKSTIISSVIAALLVTIFLNPILTFVWDISSSAIGTLFKGLLNKMYQSAAMGHRNDSSFVILYFILGTATAFALLTILRSILVSIGKEHKIKNTKIPNYLKISNVIILAGLLVFIITIQFVNLQLNTSFHQRLSALAPTISDQKYKEFKASWAMMLARSDYEKINEELERIANDRGIMLPELLID